MDKKELKEKLNTLVKQIETNSKDVHFAKKLVGDLLSVKGQLDVEPLELDCGKKEKELMADTYRITLTNKGVLYHEYGGYSVFVTPNITALYETLADMVISQETDNALEGEQKEQLELMMTALGWVLQTPKIAPTNADLTLEVATSMLRHINKQYEELSKQPLQEETVQEDEEFKQATLALEGLKEEIKKEG